MAKSTDLVKIPNASLRAMTMISSYWQDLVSSEAVVRWAHQEARWHLVTLLHVLMIHCPSPLSWLVFCNKQNAINDNFRVTCNLSWDWGAILILKFHLSIRLSVTLWYYIETGETIELYRFHHMIVQRLVFCSKFCSEIWRELPRANPLDGTDVQNFANFHQMEPVLSLKQYDVAP